MKAQFEQIGMPHSGSMLFREFQMPSFDAPYHFHPEFELTLVLNSTGKRFVGNHISDFEAGDLVLLGSNLPHCWKNDPLPEGQQAHWIVIQFREDFLGKDFFKTVEMGSIARLLERAKAGLGILGKTGMRVGKEMQFLKSASPFQRVLGLLDLLNTLATSDETRSLDTSNFFPSLAYQDFDRLNKVYGYITEHFQEDISLDEVAETIAMTTTAFCRYFKKVTKKTFVEMLTEYRVGYATQLLQRTDKSVAEVCFESGFGNLSHFNKQFKQITQHSPLQYRKAFVM